MPPPLLGLTEPLSYIFDLARGGKWMGLASIVVKSFRSNR
jgi:hypothetical protein